jgi:hypothetical protein
MLVCVTAANNGGAITDATFSVDYFRWPDTSYYQAWFVDNQDCWCSAPNYQTCYFNVGTPGAIGGPGATGGTYSGGAFQIALAWKGGWPQTY